MATASWVKEFIREEIDSIFSKYCNLEVSRQTWVRQKYCKTCCSYVEGIMICKEDSFNGNCNFLGWQYCDNCEHLLELKKKYYYEKCDFIKHSAFNKTIRHLQFQFYRYSRSLNKKFIQKNCTICNNNGNILTQYQNMTIISIQWMGDMCKYVPLRNIIFYNRNIFGYSIEEFPIKEINKKMKHLIEKEYKIVNQFYNLILIVNQKSGIDDLIKSNIFRYWNDLYII